MASNFVDRVILHVSAGDGGHGVRVGANGRSSSRSAAPTVATAGTAASVVLRVDPQVDDPAGLPPPRRTGKAANGKPGSRRRAQRAPMAPTSSCRVPEGTVVKDADGERPRRPHRRGHANIVVARGGRGGLGNKALASPKRKAPGFALLGEPGRVARRRPGAEDPGRCRASIGFPSAGKS
ncbi:MAG: hypothetical protein V9F04_11965 [Dermatophilaceae bacterium]